jgi:exodeoxyribonuclease X
MVADAPTVVEDYVGFTDLLFGPAAKDFIRETIFISHNAKYDYEVVNQYADLNSSLKTHWICTLRLAKHVLGPHHDKIQYSLGYLRYYLDLDVDDALTLHRADMDVAVCWQLFLKLLELAIDEGKVDPTQDVLKQCIDLCWQPLMIQTWPFGKHRGEKLSAIPLSYFSWALDNLNSLKEDSPEFDSDLASSVAQTVEQILSREK